MGSVLSATPMLDRVHVEVEVRTLSRETRVKTGELPESLALLFQPQYGWEAWGHQHRAGCADA